MGRTIILLLATFRLMISKNKLTRNNKQEATNECYHSVMDNGHSTKGEQVYQKSKSIIYVCLCVP